jgi:hypothetical protein
VAVAVRPRWERDYVKVTVADGLRETHFAYSTALATLCGEPLPHNRKWAFADERGQQQMPSCKTCVSILEKFVEDGLERHFLIAPPQCTSITGKGTRCIRAPIPGTEKCPSHYPAARMYT